MQEMLQEDLRRISFSTPQYIYATNDHNNYSNDEYDNCNSAVITWLL